jgi:hypothetical protein
MNTLAAIVRRRARVGTGGSATGRAWPPYRTLAKSLALVDRGIEIVQRLRAHPLVIAAGVALLVWMGRRSLSRWAGRIGAVWQLYSSLKSPRQK